MPGKAENVVGLVASLGATTLTKKAVDGLWKVGSKGKTPPSDPADPNTATREAILWAVLSGASVSVVRLVMARRLARTERQQNRTADAIGAPRFKDAKASKIAP